MPGTYGRQRTRNGYQSLVYFFYFFSVVVVTYYVYKMRRMHHAILRLHIFLFPCTRVLTLCSHLLAHLQLFGRRLHFVTNLDGIGTIDKLGKLVKVQITVRIRRRGIDLVHVL
jgi:hypothetical protein